MNKPTIEAMTWGTLTGAVLSACLLAAVESGLPDGPLLLLRPGQAASNSALPSEPAAAGPRRPQRGHGLGAADGSRSGSPMLANSTR